MKLIWFIFSLILFLPINAQQNVGKCGDPDYSVAGKINSLNASTITILFQETPAVKVGDKGEILITYEESGYGILWSTEKFSMAEVSVVSISGKTISFKIIEKNPPPVDTPRVKQYIHFNVESKVSFNRYTYKAPAQIKESWSNGKTKETGTKVCDLKTGDWKYYNENGTLLSIEHFDDHHRKNGIIEQYDSTGILKSTTTYWNGVQHGSFIKYHSNGKKAVQEIYFHGYRVSNITEWFENGAMKSTGEKASSGYGELIGIWTYYYENGGIREIGSYENGERSGIWEEYYESGKKKSEMSYDKGEFHGIAKEYDEEGFLKYEMQYEHDEATGVYKEFYASGKLLTEGNYNNLQKTGEWKGYFENGGVSYQMIYKNDIPVGAVSEWFENGVLAATYFYNENGELDGKFDSYYENGKNLESGYFKNNAEIGKWFVWDEKGKKKVVKY